MTPSFRDDLPVQCANLLLETLAGIHLSAGFTVRARRRAATRLLATFFPHMRTLLTFAPVLHADETPGRAAGALTYVHVACTEYLTLMHIGGCSAEEIDAGGVLPYLPGVLVRDGSADYDRLPALHAWCGTHAIRDLRSVSDADPAGRVWALAMATPTYPPPPNGAGTKLEALTDLFTTGPWLPPALASNCAHCTASILERVHHG